MPDRDIQHGRNLRFHQNDGGAYDGGEVITSREIHARDRHARATTSGWGLNEWRASSDRRIERSDLPAVIPGIFLPGGGNSSNTKFRILVWEDAACLSNETEIDLIVSIGAPRVRR